MALVAATAVFLSFTGTDPFLFLLAIFAFYLVFSGWRVLRRKRLREGERVPVLDWVVTG